MSGLFKIKFSELSPITKVAITWAGWATVCLTGYYFARRWSLDQREEMLKMRKVINDEFGVKLAKAAALMDTNENSAKETIKKKQ